MRLDHFATNHYTARPAFIALIAVASACSTKASRVADTATAAAAAATPPNIPSPEPPPGVATSTMVRGAVTSVSATELVVKSDTSTATIKLASPVMVYGRAPADLSVVKPNTFIGVTSVKQADGSERATEIHVFPEDLRGLGEGSRMMTQNAAPGSRMTNGTANPSSGSRMSNGNIASANGNDIVVQYAGGSQTITVPPNTPVTQLKPLGRALAVGDQVVVLTTRNADGSLLASKVLVSSK